ncbi:MAG: ribosomal protein S18-alanine N-acetyltransferase [Acidobacteria bacterium]|jgi:ribosomal-protein-alanine N-acetyltransferase|nr:ribosomal protein S18-alanine N-acetyltransferase [Acidobacteriota bacterium]
MAVLQKIREFFVPPIEFEPEIIVPAPLTTYVIRPLTNQYLKEILKLNLRCFKAGENYTKHTFSYLLNEPNSLSYRIVTPHQSIIGFIFVMVDIKDGTGHITTVAVAPEHRRRGLGIKLLRHTEEALRKRGISTMMLEVRVGNIAAQNLYRGYDYTIVQRLPKYYSNGEDGFLMVKSL